MRTGGTGNVWRVDLGLKVEERGDVAVLAVSGEVDVATVPRLREQLHALVASGTPRIVVDLDAVDFLDSTGLGVLVGALKRVRNNGGELALVCTSPRIRKVFEVTGLTKVFSLYDTVDAAASGTSTTDS
jgi:anti-sigma B factor antagonist